MSNSVRDEAILKIIDMLPTDIPLRVIIKEKITALINSEVKKERGRIEECEKALLDIKKRLPAFAEDRYEKDKLCCHVGSIESILARVIPEWKYGK